jgi:hypothetical protein
MTKEGKAKFKELLKSQGYLCYWCQYPIVFPSEIKKKNIIEKTHTHVTYLYNTVPNQTAIASIEHVLPKWAGGGDGDNLVATCRECNRDRGEIHHPRNIENDHSFREWVAMKTKEKAKETVEGFKVGDLVETCSLMPGIIVEISGRNAHIRMFDGPEHYVNCSLVHCGLKVLTAQQMLQRTALGRGILNMLYLKQVNQTSEDETIDWDAYQESIEATYRLLK